MMQIFRAAIRWFGWVRAGLLGWASLWGAVGCASSIQVRSSFDERADFAVYHSFAMLEPDRAVPTTPDVDPFLMQRLRRMVREELLARGFREAPAESAQLRVGVMAVVRGRLIVYPTTFSYGYRWGYPWGGHDVRQVDEGTIVIDLIDAARNAVVWRGVGTRIVTSRTTDEDLHEVVQEIVDDYPPGPED